jgi:hypothetical protein
VPEPLPPSVPAAPEARPQNDDLDAALAAKMARMQERLSRIGVAPTEVAAKRPLLLSSAASPVWQAIATAAVIVVSTIVILYGYLLLAVPGPWFPIEPPLSFGTEQLEVMRGSAARTPEGVAITAAGADGVTIVSVNTELRADRFRALWWIAANVPEGASVRAVWRSDTRPGQTYSLPVTVEAGRPRPVQVAGAQGWVGTIKGIGLVVTGRLEQPMQVRGVIAKPMGAVEVLRDRSAEWFALETWNGTSINVVVGGADVQDLPLPLLVMAIAGLATILLLALRRWRSILIPNIAGAVAVVFIVGWLVLDVRWAANLSRQAGLTWSSFAGKTERDQRLAAPDGEVYEFVERVKAALPPTPQRLWVASDAPFFNGRVAYQLYPHNVHFEPRSRAMPEPTWVKPGDWLLVYSRRGVEFDAARGMLRWDGLPAMAAQLKVAGGRAALFRIE